jgi:hypothetical protein
MILELERELKVMVARYERALNEIDRIKEQMQELMNTRDRNSMVPFRDVRRVRRAMKADLVDDAGRRRAWPAPPISE